VQKYRVHRALRRPGIVRAGAERLPVDRDGYTLSRNRPPRANSNRGSAQAKHLIAPRATSRAHRASFRGVRVEEDSGEVTPRRFNTSRSRPRHPGWPSCGRITQTSHRKARFRFGSIASVRPTADRFRSTPNCGHHASGPPLPKGANCRLVQRSRRIVI